MNIAFYNTTATAVYRNKENQIEEA